MGLAVEPPAMAVLLCLRPKDLPSKIPIKSLDINLMGT